MFVKINRIVGILAIVLFTYVQFQGWNLFDNEAQSSHGGSGGSGRTYHK